MIVHLNGHISSRSFDLCEAETLISAHDEFIKYLTLLMVSELQAGRVGSLNLISLRLAAGTMQQFGGNL